MSLNRYDKRVDNNQTEIIEEARRCGAVVEVLSKPVDLLVSVDGVNLLWEVKGPRGTLTPAQVDFKGRWPGGFTVVRSPAQARAEIVRVRRTMRCTKTQACPMRLMFPCSNKDSENRKAPAGRFLGSQEDPARPRSNQEHPAPSGRHLGSQSLPAPRRGKTEQPEEPSGRFLGSQSDPARNRKEKP